MPAAASDRGKFPLVATYDGRNKVGRGEEERGRRADGSFWGSCCYCSSWLRQSLYYSVLLSSVLCTGRAGWGVYYKCIIMGGGVAGICIACVPTTGSIGSPTQANIDNSLELFSNQAGVFLPSIRIQTDLTFLPMTRMLRRESELCVQGRC